MIWTVQNTDPENNPHYVIFDHVKGPTKHLKELGASAGLIGFKDQFGGHFHAQFNSLRDGEVPQQFIPVICEKYLHYFKGQTKSTWLPCCKKNLFDCNEDKYDPCKSPETCVAPPKRDTGKKGCDETWMQGGADYVGCQRKTRSGRTCQRWDQQSPHKHRISGLDKDENFCRNPDNEPTIWCYTTDPGHRWEFCDPIGGIQWTAPS